MIALALGVLIAFVNGANDVSKGIATLAGSGVTNYRRAIAWGTVWTAAGALAASVFGGALLATFGHGLLAPGTAPTASAAIATLVGAAAWVAIATRTGLPVSTTHAIVGSLAGVAALAYGPAGVRWSALGGKVALPLLGGPLISLVLTALLARLAGAAGGRRAREADCVCAEVVPAVVAVPVAASTLLRADAAPQGLRLRVFSGSVADCAAAHPAAARLSVDVLHWITSGATSFARGLNDTPKIVALVLAASALTAAAPASAQSSFALAALGMTVGSALGGMRVTSLLAERVVALDHRDGFLANLVTSLLVGLGALGGLPLSTTHVSAGAIFGTGVGAGGHARRLDLGTVRNMLLAWIVTVPAAALLGVLSFWLIGGHRSP